MNAGAMNADLTGLHRSVIVVGGGQAGLSMSYCLTARGIDHIVLEREQVAHEWRNRRWDSFCLVTPNWQCQLPGFGYPGADPHGFMVRDQIVQYLQDYAASFKPPLVEGVTAQRLRRTSSRAFEVVTSQGVLTADQVVVATGPYQVPVIPRIAERLPPAITQLHSSQYRTPDELPAGPVLVVGTGQSGCQITEDLHLAGREVHLAVGRAPRVARFYRGRDVVAWLDDMGYYRKNIGEFDDVDAVRFRVNHYVTGRDGGRDIDLRAFAKQGMHLHGRLLTCAPTELTFADDLARNLDAADAVSESIKDTVDAYIARMGIEAPSEERYRPVWLPDEGSSTVDVGEIGSVVWATGFGADYRWIEEPVFDGRGYPTHQRGVTARPGLYFLGLPWQYTWGSGRFCGVGADAEHLAIVVAQQRIAHRSFDVRWISGTPTSTYPDDDHWVIPRTVA
jgi:putative flavoprotein involved in K+ transport